MTARCCKVPTGSSVYEELSAERESIYAEADFTVDTDELTVDQVVQRIQQQLCRP